MSKPTDLHHFGVHRLLRYLKTTIGRGIFFSTDNNLSLRASLDSDWARCEETRRSITSSTIYLGDSLISWKSKKQPTISTQSLEAEYMALCTTTCELQWILYILQDLHIPHPRAVIVYTDSVSAYCISHNPVPHEKSNRIQIDVHFTRKKIQEGVIKLTQIPTSQNLAD